MKWFWAVWIFLLILVLQSAVSGAETGRVVAVQGVTWLKLEDGREIGVLGIDVKGLTETEHERAKKWMEVFLLGRTVEFRDTYRTGFGRVAGIPVWNQKDVVGSLIVLGMVKQNPLGVPPKWANRWQRLQQNAKSANRGLWKNRVEKKTYSYTQVPTNWYVPQYSVGST